MSTSSLEQAILKISKVMEDFVGEQQNINSHLNEKIDNLESSINVRMEGFWDFSPQVGEATKVMLTSNRYEVAKPHKCSFMNIGHLLDLQYNGS
ncbi:hypothetical protein AAG906_029770 [Vitis piasezkii]